MFKCILWKRPLSVEAMALAQTVEFTPPVVLRAVSNEDGVHRAQWSVRFPMLCFCEPGSEQEPCITTRGVGHNGSLPYNVKFMWSYPILTWYALKYLKLGYMNKFYVDDYPNGSLGVMALFWSSVSSR